MKSFLPASAKTKTACHFDSPSCHFDRREKSHFPIEKDPSSLCAPEHGELFEPQDDLPASPKVIGKLQLKQRFCMQKNSSSTERGAALIVVTFLLLIVLVGGLAAVAITGSELNSSVGFRSREVTASCARAALEHIRSILPDNSAQSIAADIDIGGGNTLHYQAGHYDNVAATVPFTELAATSGDFSSAFEGVNITNKLDYGGGGGGANLSSGIHFITTTATCRGPNFGEREVQLVLRYGIATP
ncbi:MAG: hypothetical protein JW841_13480 [Deltaproteobacteria bacterium]|nr:hypothetical protein [Deltaproteobacteria bacterium]